MIAASVRIDIDTYVRAFFYVEQYIGSIKKGKKNHIEKKTLPFIQTHKINSIST